MSDNTPLEQQRQQVIDALNAVSAGRGAPNAAETLNATTRQITAARADAR